jgi:hypothetical protein
VALLPEKVETHEERYRCGGLGGILDSICIIPWGCREDTYYRENLDQEYVEDGFGTNVAIGHFETAEPEKLLPYQEKALESQRRVVKSRVYVKQAGNL